MVEDDFKTALLELLSFSDEKKKIQFSSKKKPDFELKFPAPLFFFAKPRDNTIIWISLKRDKISLKFLTGTLPQFKLSILPTHY